MLYQLSYLAPGSDGGTMPHGKRAASKNKRVGRTWAHLGTATGVATDVRRWPCGIAARRTPPPYVGGYSRCPLVAVSKCARRTSSHGRVLVVAGRRRHFHGADLVDGQRDLVVVRVQLLELFQYGNGLIVPTVLHQKLSKSKIGFGTVGA